MARFQNLTNQMLTILGYPEEHLTTYRAARLMPSLADLLDFPPQDRSKIGGWITQEQREQTRDMQMPNHYSHYAMQVETDIRARAIIQVREALRCHQKAGLKRELLQTRLGRTATEGAKSW